MIKHDNKVVYKLLKEQKHSTFDLSKFTVVGTPTITNNGIASGFGTNDYVNLTSLVLTQKQNIVIEFEYTASSIPSDTVVILSLYNDNTRRFYLTETSAGKLQASFEGSGGGFTVLDDFYTQNTSYKFKIVTNLYDTWTLYCNDVAIITPTGITAADRSANKICIGHNNGSRPANGSSDLKQFEVKVDGYPVFSGNKTELDIIKPNDYTVVGSPTITDDGLFYPGITDYISTNLDLSGSWTMFFQFCLNDVTSQNVSPLLNASSYNRVFVSSNAYVTVFADENNAAPYSVNIFTAGTIKANTNYFLKLSFNGTSTYSAVLTNLETGEVTSDVQTMAHQFYSGSHTLYIGSDGSRYIKGFMDLNELKIYKGTELIYQPCLKVPYTKSDIGNKIVDAIYENRLEDTENKYFLIKEQNETYSFPKGNLYDKVTGLL